MLPFIAGLATGIITIVAYKNNKKIKEQVQKGACSVKKLTQEGFEKSKETIEYVKQRFEESQCKTQETPIDEKPKTAKSQAPKKKNLPKEDTK